MAQVGAKVNFFLTGAPVDWFTDASMSVEDNAEDIMTNDGFVGVSPGTPMVSIDFNFSIPPDGANAGEIINQIAGGQFAPAQFNAGALQYAANGKVRNASIEGGAGKATAGSATWRGPLTPVEF